MSAPIRPGTYNVPTTVPTTVNVPATQTFTASAPVATPGAVAPCAAAPMAAWAHPSGWCLPFIIYFVLAIIGFILLLSNLFSASNTSTSGQKWLWLILSLIWLIFFGWLIYYLCSRGKNVLAWVVLFLPLILLALVYLFFIGALAALMVTGNVASPAAATV